MRYLILLIVLACSGAIIYGFNIEDPEGNLAHKYIGSGTLGLFLIAMPLFLYSESKGKKFKDYMLTEESVRKMQGKEPKKSDDTQAL